MFKSSTPTHVLGVLTLATARYVAAVDLPYNPTRIFRDSSSVYAYILQPDTDAVSNGQAKLLSVDISDSLEASDLSQTTLYASLPFLDTDSLKATLSVVDGSGNITVLSGNCSTETGTQIWTFSPDSSKKHGNGTWTQRTLSSKKVGAVKYLSAGISFSEQVSDDAADTNLHMFGGMCPWSNSTSDTWTTAANYTNQMIEYSPEVGTKGNISYTAEVIASRGPPVAEAGFTITPLTAAYSANTTDDTQTRQQNFVLIGGHTSGAFINMSSIALYALPEQSWSFIGVDQPSSSSSSKRDLVARDTATEVEPRSGHTAVLSSDGTSIVVFGGWVGDVTTPADPQLAVLELGEGYGGDGDWTWTIPDVGSSNISGAGLYGHGALMLPGDVMMISGGYSIPDSSTSSRLLRRATVTSSSQTLFYNVSSKSWLSTYDPPASVTSSTSLSETKQKGALTTTSQKAGLGVGLTVGIALVVGLLVYYFWRLRAAKRKRRHRESDKEGLVRRTDTFGNSWFGAPGIDGRGGADIAGGLWNEKEEEEPQQKPNTIGGYSWLPQDINNEQVISQPRHEIERSGLMVSNPSPTRGMRKGAPSRAQYQYHAAPRYEDGRMSRSSNIHPIEERDEEDDRILTPAERKLKDLEALLGGGRPLSTDDPFKDPPPNPLRSHPVSPDIGPPVGSTVRRSITNATNGTNVTTGTNISGMTTHTTDQVSSWIREWTASYAAAMRPTADNPHASSSGRSSPTKTDERTSSSLSEASNRSGLSASARSIARTSSTRSGLFFGMSGTPSITPTANTPTEDRFLSAPTTGRSRSPMHSQHRLDRPGAHRTATAETASSAQTTWGALIEQSEALLGSAPTSGPVTLSNHSRGNSGNSNISGNNHNRDTIAPLNYPKRRLTEKARMQDQTSTAQLLANAGPTPPIPPRRRLGWMGSLRRALGTYDRSFSSAAPLNPHHINTSVQPLQQYHDERSASCSPTRSNGVQSRAGASSSMSNGPRRTASDSSEFLRFKRGRRDWENENAAAFSDPRWQFPYRDEPDEDLGGDWGEGMIPEIMVVKPSISHSHYEGGGMLKKQISAGVSGPRDSAYGSGGPSSSGGIGALGGGGNDKPLPQSPELDDWDIETAAANRDVQVMFTLPKARLRVVNADPERASQRSISEGAVSIRSAAGRQVSNQQQQQQQDKSLLDIEDHDAPLPPRHLSLAPPALSHQSSGEGGLLVSRKRSRSRSFGDASDDAPRIHSESNSLESFRTANATPAAETNEAAPAAATGLGLGGLGEQREGSNETVRKTSNYGLEILDWEREALEERDRYEEAQEEEKEEARKREIRLKARQDSQVSPKTMHTTGGGSSGGADAGGSASSRVGKMIAAYEGT